MKLEAKTLVFSCGLLAAFLIGILTGYYLSFTKYFSSSAVNIEKPSGNHVETYNFPDISLEQNGKNIFLPDFFSIFRDNPNRFNAISEKSKFHVEGRILKIHQSNDVIDKISGFNIPLIVPFNSDGIFERGQAKWPEDVSIFVLGMSKSDISALKVGDIVKVDCTKARAFNETLIFDDCAMPKAKNEARIKR